MNKRRTNRSQAEAQLDAALVGIPAAGYDADVLELASYASLLAPKVDPDAATAHRAGLEQFLLEARLVAADGVDFAATCDTDDVTPVHTADLSTADGGTIRAANVEPLTAAEVNEVAARISSRLASAPHQ